MLEFLPSISSLFSFGTLSAISKKAITEIGRHRAIVYAYVVMIALLLAGAFLMGLNVHLPQDLMPLYAAEVIIGSLGVMASYKALHYGESSLTAPISKSYVLIVLVMSIAFLEEELSFGQIAGSVIMVIATLILAMDGKGLKSGPWLLYLGFAILCRAFYYTFIKNFVLALGAFEATVLLELGITVFVISFHAIRGRDISPPSLRQGIFPALAGTLAFSGSLLYSISVGMVGAALTAAVSAGTPIINAVASYFLLGERLDAHKYAAIALMVIGLICIFAL
ncbi:MAG: DMT family transporter [Candidatus Micrarchaeota archaeon]